MNQEERYFFSTNVVEAVREFFFMCMLYVSMYIFTYVLVNLNPINDTYIQLDSED